MKAKTLRDMSFTDTFFPRGSKVTVLPHEELLKYMKGRFISRFYLDKTANDCVMVVFDDDETKLGRIIVKTEILEVKK